MMRWLMAAASAALMTSAAQAADKNPCNKDMVCASERQTIVDALQKEGYEAKFFKEQPGK